MMKKTLMCLALMLFFSTLSVFAKSINAGPWRFELRMTNAVVPFIIEFEYDKNKHLTGILKNGKEKIPLNDIAYIDKDIIIPLGAFEIALELQQQEENILIGNLVRRNKNPMVKTNIIGIQGIKERYPGRKTKPTIDLNGTWSLELTDDNDIKSKGVGTFKQKNNKLSGSILTPTGDYRYLSGYVSGDQFEAASFDGVYNYIFKGAVKNGTLEASILSNLTTKVKGIKDPKAELPDPYAQTQIKEMKFIFPDLSGQNVSLNHLKFQNKPVIIQIFGSWCPNCLDEMNYLVPWYNANHKRGIEIVALAFERSLGAKEATVQLLKLRNRLKVPYPILQVGSTSEDKPVDKLPGLTNFISFPTTIFLNKKHQVVKVHAGFTGPSTGDFFEKWKQEFNETVNELLD